MKTILWTVVLSCVLFTEVLHAQFEPERETTEIEYRERAVFGLKGGLNYSNVWGETNQAFTPEHVFGLAVGIFSVIPITPLVGIQPEVLFSQKGYQRAGMVSDNTYSFTRHSSYLDIPIQAQLKPSTHFSLLAGPAFSILLNNNDTYSFATGGVQEFRDVELQSFVLGGTIGADVYADQLVFSLRFGWDFLANDGERLEDLDTNPRYRNRFIQLTFGYRL